MLQNVGIKRLLFIREFIDKRWREKACFYLTNGKQECMSVLIKFIIKKF